MCVCAFLCVIMCVLVAVSVVSVRSRAKNIRSMGISVNSINKNAERPVSNGRAHSAGNGIIRTRGKSQASGTKTENWRYRKQTMTGRQCKKTGVMVEETADQNVACTNGR